jgi:hypothetical protein
MQAMNFLDRSFFTRLYYRLDPSYVKVEFQSYEEAQSHTAFTFGAGVNWFDAYCAAHEHNVTLVGGTQAGVGVAGGWLVDGGHSILTPAFGLGVDHVLQFKVILANGEHVTVNKCQHPNFFWGFKWWRWRQYGV